MDYPIIRGEVFDRKDYTAEGLVKGEYEQCAFRNCNFADSDLSGIRFTECGFTACDLSLANLSGAALNEVTFTDCKLLGLRFDTCDEFALSVSFKGCILNNSSFYKRKLPKTLFDGCRMHEVDFNHCVLTSSRFPDCDLSRSVFFGCDLRSADFRTAYNFIIDPEENRMKKARFSLPGAAGLLQKYDIEIDG